MRRRIVLATESLDPSGMGEHMLILGQGLASEFDVVLAAPDGGHGGLLTKAAQRGLRVKLLDPGRIELFRDWLAHFGGALVHVHAGIGWEGHGLVRAAKQVGIQVVRTEHLPYLITSVVQQAEYRAMLLSVDCRIAVSQAVADAYAGRGGGRLHVIANGICPTAASCTREETRAGLGIGTDDPVILTVARLTPQKGHDLLLAALPTVLRAFPNARFVLVGSGPDEEILTKAIVDQQLASNVLLLGSRLDVPNLLQSADLFVLPSRFEGLPLAVLEAMAASVPVVATAVGGNIEALGAEHPLLVPAEDPRGLAAAIIRALTDPAATQAATEEVRRRYNTQFTGERMASETAAVYRSFIGNSEPQGAAA